MDYAAGDHRRLKKTPANDNKRATLSGAMGRAAFDRLLDIAGAIRFALLLAGI